MPKKVNATVNANGEVQTESGIIIPPEAYDWGNNITLGVNDDHRTNNVDKADEFFIKEDAEPTDENQGLLTSIGFSEVRPTCLLHKYQPDITSMLFINGLTKYVNENGQDVTETIVRYAGVGAKEIKKVANGDGWKPLVVKLGLEKKSKEYQKERCKEEYLKHVFMHNV